MEPTQLLDTVEPDDGSGESEGGACATLDMMGDSRVFQLLEGRTLVGRDQRPSVGNHVVLLHSSVSGRHAVIELQKSGPNGRMQAFVTDIVSTNGTFVGSDSKHYHKNTRIQPDKPTPLPHCGIICFGDRVARFEFIGAALAAMQDTDEVPSTPPLQNPNVGSIPATQKNEKTRDDTMPRSSPTVVRSSPAPVPKTQVYTTTEPEPRPPSVVAPTQNDGAGAMPATQAYSPIAKDSSLRQQPSAELLPSVGDTVAPEETAGSGQAAESANHIPSAAGYASPLGTAASTNDRPTPKRTPDQTPLPRTATLPSGANTLVERVGNTVAPTVLEAESPMSESVPESPTYSFAAYPPARAKQDEELDAPRDESITRQEPCTAETTRSGAREPKDLAESSLTRKDAAKGNELIVEPAQPVKDAKQETVDPPGAPQQSEATAVEEPRGQSETKDVKQDDDDQKRDATETQAGPEPDTPPAKRRRVPRRSARRRAQGNDEEDKEVEKMRLDVPREPKEPPSPKRRQPPRRSARRKADTTSVKSDIVKKPTTSPPQQRPTRRSTRSAKRKRTPDDPVKPQSERLAPRQRANSSPPKRFLVTGIDAEALDVPETVKILGGSLVSSAADGCTHVLTDRVRRTEKFLSGMGVCSHVVHFDYVLQSQKKGRWLPESRFILRDPDREKQYKFSLKTSLARARRAKLLDGYTVYETAGTRPPFQQMATIVRCAGGVMARAAPRAHKINTLIVSCQGDLDSKQVQSLLSRGYTVYSNELILTGVLRQRLELNNSKFILATPQPTRSRRKRKR